MPPRPTSVSVIGWFLLVMNILAVPTLIIGMSHPDALHLMKQSPLPISVHMTLAFVGLALNATSGLAMLYGQPWSRWLYTGWSAFAFLVGFATSPMKVALIPGAVVCALCVLFLFSPPANAYFRARGAASDDASV